MTSFFFFMISIVEVASIRPASKAFNYEYGVQDDYSKTAFAKTEFQDDVGKVSGSYKVSEDEIKHELKASILC